VRVDAQRKNRLPSAALLLLAAAMALSAAVPPAASANLYEVFEVCRRSHAGLTFEDFQAFPEEPLEAEGFRVVDKCQPTGDGSVALVGDGAHFLRGKRWVLRAPDDTRIRGVEFERISKGPWPGSFVWQLKDANGRTWEEFRSRPPDDRIVHGAPNIETTAITATLFCEVAEGCPGRPDLTTASVEVKDLTLLLEDDFPPRFVGPLGGSLISDGALRGTERVTYAAKDRGAGIAGAFLLVDGVPQVPDLDPNGGACEEPYLVMVPCRLQVSSSVALDTELLTEGTHEVQLVLADGAGNLERSVPVQVQVHNAPTVVGRPALAGSARVGTRLTVSSGSWEGDPDFFTYQWFRCPPEAGGPAGCTAIPGATTAAYIPSKADLQQRELVAVTATNFGGSEVAFSNVSSPIADEAAGKDTTPPVLRNVRLSRKQFLLAGLPPKLGFSSSEPGMLVAGVVRAGKAGGKPLALLRRKIEAGRGAFALGGLLRQRQMRPGKYRLLVYAADTAGNLSQPARLPFTILIG
jgi:hypothetical protein